MRALRAFITIIILLVAAGAALYPNRAFIAEWYRQQTAPTLPPPVTHQQVVEGEVPEQEATLVDTAVDLVEVAVEANGNQEELLFDIIEEELPLDITSDDTVEEDVAALFEEEADAAADTTLIVPEEAPALPASINLAVPFTPQAPHADWALPYKEACEEASVYMVKLFYDGVGEGLVDANVAKQAIDKLVEFENSFFGYFEDTNALQTAAFAETFYGFEQVALIEDPSVEDIKSAIAAGRPVIVPAAGRQLGNPFFTEPGPLYHMLVVRGYTADGKFITNDPGTKRGEAFLYDFDTLMSAMHDWNGGEVDSGRKVVIVIHPNE